MQCYRLTKCAKDKMWTFKNNVIEVTVFVLLVMGISLALIMLLGVVGLP